MHASLDAGCCGSCSLLARLLLICSNVSRSLWNMWNWEEWFPECCQCMWPYWVAGSGTGICAAAVLVRGMPHTLLSAQAVLLAGGGTLVVALHNASQGLCSCFGVGCYGGPVNGFGLGLLSAACWLAAGMSYCCCSHSSRNSIGTEHGDVRNSIGTKHGEMEPPVPSAAHRMVTAPPLQMSTLAGDSVHAGASTSWHCQCLQDCVLATRVLCVQLQHFL
ncbi:hypothetical protein COO60DRAFT_1539501 [Scenedesmus sp. NREL 46B-D3]|nr:hypothetical protein COO60DRAFT_1539501 [Scenedesmus sp. NREL 46B-D3]